jgi:hypothetical protein
MTAPGERAIARRPSLRTISSRRKPRLLNAERADGEETNKAREDVRIASGKIESLTAKLSDLRHTESKSQNSRCSAMAYAGVVMGKAAQIALVPRHYACRQLESRSCTTKNLLICTIGTQTASSAFEAGNLGITMR